MRIEVEIEGDLVRKARELTGLGDPAALVELALNQVVERESARRLASGSGAEAGLTPVRRRRP